jgi:hypothetical protein
MSDLPLDNYLRRLRLPTARRRYQELEQQAVAESWSYGEYLERLAAEELADRQERRIAQASRKAGFPFLKTLEEFDFSFQTSINRRLLGPYLGAALVSGGRSLVLAPASLMPAGRGKNGAGDRVGLQSDPGGSKRPVCELHRADR